MTGNTPGVMGHCTLVTGLTTRSMALEPTTGPMVANTRANGKTITCMDTVSTHGQTDACMRVTI